MDLYTPDSPLIRVTGRADTTVPGRTLLTWPGSSLRFILKGRQAVLHLESLRSYWKTTVGIIVNGVLRHFELPDGQRETDISEYLTDGVNDVLVYKRQDACNYLAFRGVSVTGELLPLPDRPCRRIEAYGDSVSAGECCEATDRVGQPDPEGHEGLFSDSYRSYVWQTARALNAEAHIISQGGIALKNGTGWFSAPDTVGMESCWDKCAYSPSLGPLSEWDFSRWTPQIVIVAIGQNDAHPVDLMKEDPRSEKARAWIRDYAGFIGKLREKYPKAEIILLTTLLMHDPAWDDAIEQARQLAGDEHVRHFLFRRNGAATPGHPRIPEHEEMARELTEYIRSLGEELWDR